MNEPRIPTVCAIAPNIGPRIAPSTAIPNTVPSNSPRRSRGAETVSHDSAPAQVIPLEKPWTNRARPSEAGRPRGGEAEARDGEQQHPCDDGPFGTDAARDQPAGDPAEDRAATVRTNE